MADIGPVAAELIKTLEMLELNDHARVAKGMASVVASATVVSDLLTAGKPAEASVQLIGLIAAVQHYKGLVP